MFPDYLSVSYDYASNKEALDIHLKECTSLINESKDKRIAKMNAKLDNPKTVQNIYWSIINKFLSNKNIPIMPPLFIDCKLVSDFKQKPIKNGSKLTFFFYKTEKRLTSFNIKDDDILPVIKNLNVYKAHRWDQLSIRMIKACGNSEN